MQRVHPKKPTHVCGCRFESNRRFDNWIAPFQPQLNHAHSSATPAAECDVVQEVHCVSEGCTSTTAASELDMTEIDKDPAEVLPAPTNSTKNLEQANTENNAAPESRHHASKGTMCEDMASLHRKVDALMAMQGQQSSQLASILNILTKMKGFESVGTMTAEEDRPSSASDVLFRSGRSKAHLEAAASRDLFSSAEERLLRCNECVPSLAASQGSKGKKQVNPKKAAAKPKKHASLKKICVGKPGPSHKPAQQTANPGLHHALSIERRREITIAKDTPMTNGGGQMADGGSSGIVPSTHLVEQESPGARTGAGLRMIEPMKRRAAFRHLRDLRAHLISEHGMATAAEVVMDQFPSMEAFEVWIAAYSQYQGVKYVNTASEPDFGMHPSGEIVRHYQCFQVGSPPFFHCIEEACLSNKRLLGQAVQCTSEIVATVQEDASVTAVVHSFHYGHSTNERTPTTLVHEADEEDQGSAPAELNTDSAADRDDTEQDDRAALERIVQESLQTMEFPDIAGHVVEIIDVASPTHSKSEAEEDDRDECDAEAASESGSTTESLVEVTYRPEAPAELIHPHEASDFTELNADYLTACSTAELAQTISSKLSVMTEHDRSAQQQSAQSRDVLLRLHSQVEQLQQLLEHMSSVTSAETSEMTTGSENEISPVDFHHAIHGIVNDHSYVRYWGCGW